MERRDPLWEDILVHRSCQVWSRRTYLRMMILYTQKCYCKEKENELKKFSQQDRLSKLGTDAEFLAAVEVGQYFMTRDTEEFSQMTDSVACRENTMPRDAEASEPKGWIRGNTKIGPVLEVTTCCLQGKYGVESIVKSVKSQSWVRISHGLKKLVTNVNNKDQDDNEQETSEMQFEEYALKLNASDFASRSKAKANPQRRDSASSPTRTIPIRERTWTDAEPQKYSLSDYPVSKKLINLLRHGSLPRDNDGAIEFWRIKGYLQDHLVFCQTNDDEKWKSRMAGGGGHKKIFQYCTDSSRTILYFRALQGHSGCNLIDLSLQDSVVIPDGFFKYIYHVGCAINLHSIGLIPGGQNLSHRYFFCLWIPWTKIIRILTRSTWKQCVLHSTCMKHGRNIETLCVGSTSHLLKRKDWNSIRHDRTLSFFTKNTPSLLCSESCSDGNWRSHIRESTCVTSISSKNFLEKWLDEGIWFRSCSTCRRRSCSTSKRLPTNPNPNHDRTGRPVVCSEDRYTFLSWLQERQFWKISKSR